MALGGFSAVRYRTSISGPVRNDTDPCAGGDLRAFGVSWTNYVLQASLMTRFFATCVMFAGLRLGLTLSVAALFGAIAGVIAYPPMSTPYVDNHAAIVSSLLVLGIVLGIMDADKRPMWWLLAPPLAIVAFLCKQSPTLFVVAFCGVAIFFTAWHQGAIRDLIYVLVASALCDVNCYRDLLAELAKRSRPALFLSDSVLDPIVGQAPVAPALFWHAVLSFPVDGRAREIFNRQFKYDIIKSGSDLVVLDGARTGWVSRSKIFAGWTRVSGQTRCAASEDSR